MVGRPILLRGMTGWPASNECVHPCRFGLLISMKVSYDVAVDAAYIRLVDSIGIGGVEFTYGCDPAEVGGMIHLDFNSDGALVGIEVLGASRLLPREVLDLACEAGGASPPAV
jgi:uncharacterized protein YuzE